MVDYSQAYIVWRERMRAGAPGALDELEALAKGGDAHALLALGEMRLVGEGFPRNLAKAYKHIAKSAELGLVTAQRAHAYLTAKGLGRKPNPTLARNMLARLAQTDRFSAVQHQLLAHATSLETVKQITPEVISQDPYIAVWRGLFGQAEYGYLQHIGTPLMQPAQIVDPRTGLGRLDPVRRSDTTSIPPTEEDLMIQEILATIAVATGTTPTQGEPLNLLRYRVGQEYRPHYDTYPPTRDMIQRRYTCIIYINDGYVGGETHFPRLDIAIKGEPGDMLVFDNLDAEGKPDERMQHAGLPVTSGEKWIATRWVLVEDTLTLGKFG